jgi:hypothetical protein
MSHDIVREIFLYAKVKDSDLLALLALAAHADWKTLTCYPSTRTLAQFTRTSVRNIQYVLRRLSALGYIRIDRGKAPRKGNLYTILAPWRDRRTGVRLNICADELEFAKGVNWSSPELNIELDISPEKAKAILNHIGLTPGSRAYEAALNGHQKKTL